MNELAAPGWYPDPEGSEGLRYWDGMRWNPRTPPGVVRADNLRAASLIVALLLWFPIGILCGIAGIRMSRRARDAAASGDAPTATRLLNQVRALLIFSVVVTAIWGIAFTAYFVSRGNR